MPIKRVLKALRRLRRGGPLERSMGYTFKNPALLELALSHRSWAHLNRREGDEEGSNERLEFLGDSVLSLVMIDHLFHYYPSEQEGMLSKMKSLLVSARILAICARRLKLGEHMLLSRSEEKSGGRDRSSILADGYEALLGAIYLDGGMKAATKIIRTTLFDIMEEVLADEEFVNYKSRLLEHAQGQGQGTPEYRVLRESGPEHDKNFSVAVMLGNQEWGRGMGRSKKDAEQFAAREAWQKCREKPRRGR